MTFISKVKVISQNVMIRNYMVVQIKTKHVSCKYELKAKHIDMCNLCITSNTPFIFCRLALNVVEQALFLHNCSFTSCHCTLALHNMCVTQFIQ